MKKIKQYFNKKKEEKETIKKVYDILHKLKQEIEEKKDLIKVLLNNLYVAIEQERLQLLQNEILSQEKLKNGIEETVKSLDEKIQEYNNYYEENRNIIDKLNKNLYYENHYKKINSNEAILTFRTCILAHLQNTQ